MTQPNRELPYRTLRACPEIARFQFTVRRVATQCGTRPGRHGVGRFADSEEGTLDVPGPSADDNHQRDRPWNPNLEDRPIWQVGLRNLMLTTETFDDRICKRCSGRDAPLYMKSTGEEAVERRGGMQLRPGRYCCSSSVPQTGGLCVRGRSSTESHVAHHAWST